MGNQPIFSFSIETCARIQQEDQHNLSGPSNEARVHNTLILILIHETPSTTLTT